MPTLADYVFPAPPVCTRLWTERDWLRFARAYGSRARRGPAPSVEMWDGVFAPFAGEWNARGEPLYACDRARRSPLPRRLGG